MLTREREVSPTHKQRNTGCHEGEVLWRKATFAGGVGGVQEHKVVGGSHVRPSLEGDTEQIPAGRKGVCHVNFWGKTMQAEGRAHVKAPGKEPAYSI